MTIRTGLGLLALALISTCGGCEQRERPASAGPGPRSDSASRTSAAPPNAAASGSERGESGRAAAIAAEGTPWHIQWEGLAGKPASGEKDVADIAEVEKLVRMLSPSTEGFIILTDPEGRFMQSALDEEGWILEFHDTVADRRGRRETELALEDVLDALRAFHGGYLGFADDHGWIRIGLDGSPLNP